jgi:hypothetical protein
MMPSSTPVASAAASRNAVSVAPWPADDEEPLRAFVDAHPEGVIYYTPQYRRFLLATLGPGCRCLYRVARRDGAISGVLPLLAYDAPFGRVLNSLPFFGSNGGALAADAESEAALRGDYERLARAPGVACATWVPHAFLQNAAPDHDIEDERIAQWTVLPETGDRDALLGLIESSARRNVAKAARLGVTVHETEAELPFLEQVHRANMAAIGGRPKPHAFFEALPGAMQFGRDWTLYIAALDGRPIAGLLLFMAARTVEYVMPAIVESEREAQPTAALLAAAMSDAAKRGFNRWNWGGTWISQDNVYRFKRKWGAREARYRYAITLNDRSLLRETATTLSQSCPGFYVVPYGMLGARS